MSDKKEKIQDPQAEAPVEQAPQAAESKKKQKKEDRKADDLKKQVAELTDKLAAEKDSYIRLMAEFETFRRRMVKQNMFTAS